jgi:hypothetical protein
MLSDVQTGEQIPITSKSVFAPHKTLGHQRAPGGKGLSQEKELRKKSNKMAQQVSCNALNSKDSRTFYDTIYLKSLGFVLPNSYFTEATLHSIQTNTICSFLPKCGYNRNTHRAIVFGPHNLAGAGFLPLYLVQGEGQLLQFLKYWRTDTPASRLLRIATAWFQYQSGLSKSIFTNVDQFLPHIESRLLPSLCKFLSRIRATIELDEAYITPAQRKHDIHIMDSVMSSSLFTTSKSVN